MTLTGWGAEKYTLYYSISDLSGDGTEELIIGIQGGDGIAPCFLYTCDGERIHITDSRTWDDLVNKPTILYENGIIESTEYIKYGMYRYNFYQRPEKLREQGGMELVDLYFYIDDPENGIQYYKGDMTNIITEEEFWSAINEYESLPQVELNWHELDGFWESDEDSAKTTVSGEEYSQGDKEKSESAAIEENASKEEAESKNNEPITIMTKVTYYHGDDPDRWSDLKYDSAGKLLGWQYYNADGNFRGWQEYEYDSAGNQVKRINYYSDGSISDWREYEYDNRGNLMSTVTHHGNGSGYRTWHEYEFDSNGNKTRDTEYDEYSGYDDPRSMKEYEYDSEGNLTKMIEHGGENWYKTEYEYMTITPHSEAIVSN